MHKTLDLCHNLLYIKIRHSGVNWNAKLLRLTVHNWEDEFRFVGRVDLSAAGGSVGWCKFVIKQA